MISPTSRIDQAAVTPAGQIEGVQPQRAVSRRTYNVAMKASAFWKAVLVDRDNLLERFLALLRESGVRYCVIGGTGVNAYAYPVVTQDLDIVVAAEQLEGLERTLASQFSVERFANSINVMAPDSNLRVQIQTDSQYAAFVDRATVRDVMGFQLPVARLEDLLQGKIWAALDATRRPSKQLKDLSDIARIIEAAPELRERVPAGILARIPRQAG